jgi:hypothetical protein
VGTKRNKKIGSAMCWNPANSEGIILQGHSYREGMSWFADRDEPEEEQMSRVNITAVSPCEGVAARACTGAARESMRVQRISTLIFLMPEM